MSDQTITKFYQAFQKRDAATMASCYTQDVTFWDPVFHELKGDRARAMWKMLCERGADLDIEYSDVKSDGKTGRAHWDARYTFSATRRKVLNRIDAEFRFEGDKISWHRDSFSLWRWSSQALGPVGVALGWLPPMQNKIHVNAVKALDAYLAR